MHFNETISTVLSFLVLNRKCRRHILAVSLGFGLISVLLTCNATQMGYAGSLIYVQTYIFVLHYTCEGWAMGEISAAQAQ